MDLIKLIKKHCKCSGKRLIGVYNFPIEAIIHAEGCPLRIDTCHKMGVCELHDLSDLRCKKSYSYLECNYWSIREGHGELLSTNR